MKFNTARNTLAIMFYGTEDGKKINRILNQVDENPWHTGTPTEEGLFVVAYANGEHKLCNVRLNGRGELGGWFNCHDAIAHMRIEPYTEASE